MPTIQTISILPTVPAFSLETITSAFKDVPILSDLARAYPIGALAFLTGTILLAFLIVLNVIFSMFRSARKSLQKGAVRSFFNISDDLKGFDIQKMGKPGTQYYIQENMNCFNLALPYWKKANADGSRDCTKRFNKVIWQECVLWLHAGRSVYVLTTKDPWEILSLVHELRDGGLDIAPCMQELEKQERLESERKSCDEVISNLIKQMDGDHDAFVQYCREKLTAYGCSVSDAPKNDDNIDLFLHWKGRACVARCTLAGRDYLSGLEEVKTFQIRAAESFSDVCMLITTGHATVAAAGYAREHDVELICNESLVALMDESARILPGKEFMRWELNKDDMQELLPTGILASDFR